MPGFALAALASSAGIILSRRLKEIESYGLVSRHDAGKLPLHVEYGLTADGRRLDAALRRSERLTATMKRPAGKPSA